jgi:phosphoribulokinase
MATAMLTIPTYALIIIRFLDKSDMTSPWIYWALQASSIQTKNNIVLKYQGLAVN